MYQFVESCLVELDILLDLLLARLQKLGLDHQILVLVLHPGHLTLHSAFLTSMFFSSSLIVYQYQIINCGLGMRNQSSIFLTQGLNSVQARKSIVSSFVAQSDLSEFTEASRKSEELLTLIQEVRPQESIALFRQLRRQVKQSKLQGESQVLKTQKCASIDLQFFKKCINNEPLPNFQGIERMLDQQQQDNEYILQELLKIQRKIARIEEDIG